MRNNYTAPAAATAHPDAIRFLQALYLRATDGYVELRPFAPPWGDRNAQSLATRWRCWHQYSAVESIASTVARMSASGPGLETYLGVTLRRRNGGMGQDVVMATALWAELDGDVSKKGNGCRSKEEAYERLAQIQIVAPSIVVDSGGGLHAYWLLQEPLQGDDLAAVPIFNARLREALRGPAVYGPDGAVISSGYAGDQVGDLPRLLRVPGTMNYKRQNDARPVRLVDCDPECTYSLDFLDGHLPPVSDGIFCAGGGGIATPESAEMQWTPELRQRRAELIRDCAGPWSMAEGHRHFLPHPMARVLLVAGWPWEDIPSLVGEIARSGGSSLPADRERDARKELTSRASRSRVGWPWLRANVPEMAEALARYLNPATDDLAQLAADTAARRVPRPDPVPAPEVAPAVPAVPTAPVPLPGGVVMPFRLPGVPTMEQLQALQAASAAAATQPPAPAPMPAPPPGGEVIELHGKKAKEPKEPKEQKESRSGGGGHGGGDRAPEQVYNLLRDRIVWLGRNLSDRRLLAGRKRFVPELGREVVETIDLQSQEAEWWALEVVRNAGLALTESHRAVAIDMLVAEARHTDVDVAMRFAQAVDGDWLVDLGDTTWQRVRIGAGTWEVELGQEALFRRTPCTLPILRPDPGAIGSDLLVGLQTVLGYDDETCAQLACWLPQAMHPKAPRLGLLLTGPQGSGKSFAAKVMRSVIDPCVPPLLRFQQKRGEVDAKTFNVHTSSQAVLAYDNVSSLSEQASDMLCTFITGEGYLERKLHTDADPTLRFGRSGLVLTGISILGMGPDLQDRLLHVKLPVRLENDTEQALERRLEEWAPRLAGGLFAVTAEARRLLPQIEVDHAAALAKCRMRDAAAMYAATAAALGFDAGQMLQRLIRERAEAQGAEAEGDLVGERLLRYIDGRRLFSPAVEVYYEGEMGKLSESLIGQDRTPDAWPKSTRGLRAKLERLVPGLRARGIAIEFYRAQDVSRAASVRITKLGGVLPLGDEDVPILPARFGTAVQTVSEFLEATGCFADQLVELLAQGRIPQYEGWAPRAAAVAALSPRDRSRVVSAVARRYSTVALPAPQLGWDAVQWIESKPGLAAAWHAWLVDAMANAAVPF